MLPSLNKAPILATGRLRGPLKFVAFAQELSSFTCELIRGSMGASPALRSRLMAAGSTTYMQTLLSICISRLLTEYLLQGDARWYGTNAIANRSFSLLRAKFVCPRRNEAEAFQLFTERFLLHWQRVPYSQRPVSDLKRKTPCW